MYRLCTSHVRVEVLTGRNPLVSIAEDVGVRRLTFDAVCYVWLGVFLYLVPDNGECLQLGHCVGDEGNKGRWLDDLGDKEVEMTTPIVASEKRVTESSRHVSTVGDSA